MNSDELLPFSLQLAQAAAEQILPVYRNCAVSLKADGSEVTAGDHRAEQVMRDKISARFPDHDILGEEYGGGRAGRLWVLDPVDGTAAFAVGSWWSTGDKSGSGS